MAPSSPLRFARRRRVARRSQNSRSRHRPFFNRRFARRHQSGHPHDSAPGGNRDRRGAEFSRRDLRPAATIRVHGPADSSPRSHRRLLPPCRPHPMIGTAVTLSLVPEARGGPFVYWDDLPAACRRAAAHGFDAIEIFPRNAEELNAKTVRGLLEEHGLKLAAMGTGAGWVAHGLRLTDPDA